MFRLAAALVLALGSLLLPAAALAQGGPQGDQRGDPAAARQWLFEALRSAPTERLGRVIEDQVWWYWMRQAPDEESAGLMKRSMERRDAHDFAGALEIADRLVRLAPGWAAAWNERATILFRQEKYEESLVDIERTLELEPMHFGALTGRALIYLRQGRAGLAKKALGRAVAINPWLRERDMLPTEPPGTAL